MGRFEARGYPWIGIDTDQLRWSNEGIDHRHPQKASGKIGGRGRRLQDINTVGSPAGRYQFPNPELPKRPRIRTQCALLASGFAIAR
jgi:hypothetical protein